MSGGADKEQVLAKGEEELAEVIHAQMMCDLVFQESPEMVRRQSSKQAGGKDELGTEDAGQE
jgi:hypothetical protein